MSNMKKNLKSLITVIKFSIKEAITRKSYIISLIIFIGLIILGFNIPKILKEVGIDESFMNSKILIVDTENVFEGTLLGINEMKLGYEVSVENTPKTIEELKIMINEDEINTAIIVDVQDNNMKLDYIVKNKGMSGTSELLVNILSEQYKGVQISKLGLSEEELQSIMPKIEINTLQAEEKEVGSNMTAVMMISLALFMGIYIFAYQVSLSITTEKTSKIIETLVTITSPKIIVIGKTIGIGIVGLIQIVTCIVTAVISANLFLEPEMLGELVNLNNITPILIIVTLIYFVLGYFMYAFMYALTGSTVSRPEDVQNANGPVAILEVVGFYLSYFSMMNPTSKINYFASIFPLSSPFSMPLRIIMNLASWQDVLISIGLLILSIIVISKISVRIYENAILNYGTKLNLKNVLKLYKKK